MSFTIRKSTLDDLSVILSLRDQAREIMRSYGNVYQWPDGYPPEEKFRKDIELGGSHIVEDETGAIVATFALLPGPDPTYKVIYEGQWLDDAPYHVVHRIASTPESHGIFQAIMDYCELVADSIRIDTHAANVIIRHGLEKRGYQYCGIILIADGTERMAFQKILR